MHSNQGKEPEPSPALFLHEWVAVGTLSLMLVGLAILAWNDEPILPEVFSEPKPPKMIAISVTGAVNRPDTYTVPQGTTIQELLSLAELKPQAKVDKLKLDQKLQKSRKLHVPARRKAPQASVSSI